MKEVTYRCENKNCNQHETGSLPKSWMEISGGEIGLSIFNGHDGRRLNELSVHNPIHFCSRECFVDFFYKRGPKVVCLCGSTRFADHFKKENREETMAGNIVLAPGVFAHSGDFLTENDKKFLDELHFRKIDMCDEVFVLNVDGYIGESTQNEIVYARGVGKHVRFLEPV